LIDLLKNILVFVTRKGGIHTSCHVVIVSEKVFLRGNQSCCSNKASKC